MEGGGEGKARLPRRVAPEVGWVGSCPGGLESLGRLELGTDPHLVSHVYLGVAGRC